MILNKITDNLTIELSSAITTNQLDCYSIVKINGVNEPKEFNTNGTNAIYVLTPPVMDNRPTELVYLNVFNRDTLNATSTLTNNFANIKGIIKTNSTGDVIARFASEVAGSAITALAGSFVEYVQK